MLKKFSKRYVKLHKCKLRQDDPCLMPESEHGKGFFLAETEPYGKERSGDEKEDKQETPRRTQLLETIDKALLARQMQKAQVPQPQLPLALDVASRK